MTKIEPGRMELELGDVSLAALVEHALTMVRDRAGRGGVAITYELAPDLGLVRGDELKLKQVVLNLISNAVKFTPEGGSVGVTARAEGGEVVVTVRDTGMGIAETEHDRIFEAFQRGDRGIRTTTEGTGLGLTLSRQIVELHGGRIWAEFPPDGGTRFVVRLPTGVEATPGSREP